MLDGAASLAAEWSEDEQKVANQIAIEGEEMMTEPLVEEDDVAGVSDAGVEDEEAAERR